MTVSPGHASVDPNFRLPVKTTQRTADSRNTTVWGCCLWQMTEVSRGDAGFIDVKLLRALAWKRLVILEN